MFLKYFSIFLISMVPLIELRGAIPISQIRHLPIVPSYVIAIIGNMLPVPIIYLFARKVLEWGADKPVLGGFFSWCLEKGEKGGKKLQQKAGRGLFLALLLRPPPKKSPKMSPNISPKSAPLKSKPPAPPAPPSKAA